MKLAALLIPACLGMTVSVLAAEWSAAPVLAWTVDHDSNRLLVDDGPASEAAFVSLDLLLKRATPTTMFSLRPNIGWRHYTDHAAQNADYRSLQAAGSWTDDRSMFTAQASMVEDNSLNNEAPETGLLTGSSERRTRSGALAWTHDVSDRDKLAAQVSYSDIQYRNQQYLTFFGLQFPYTTLYGYRYPSVSLTETHQWTEQRSLKLSAYASRLIPDDAAAQASDSYGMQLGLQQALTPRVDLFFSAGLSRSDDGLSKQNGYIGRFELTRRHRLGSWELFAERSVAASGIGVLVRRDELGIALQQRLAPRWSSRFSLHGIRNNDLGSRYSGERGRYDRADAALDWQVTRRWTMSAGASLARARQRDGLAVVQGWSTMLSATWAPQPRAMSR
jgi:hypothetical protein